MHQRLLIAGFGLSALGAGITAYLTVAHGTGASLLCGVGQGCEVIAQSVYARVGTVPTAAFGLFMYLALTVVYGVRLLSPPPPQVQRWFAVVALVVVLIGVGFSAWLTYVGIAVLGAFCVWCTASAGIVGLLLLAGVADLYATRKGPGSQADIAGNGIKMGRSGNG